MMQDAATGCGAHPKLRRVQVAAVASLLMATLLLAPHAFAAEQDKGDDLDFFLQGWEAPSDGDPASQGATQDPSPAASAGVSDESTTTPQESAADSFEDQLEPLPTIQVETLQAVDEAAPAEPVRPPERLQRIDEIIVTAQKREERIQDVPVAITFVGQEQLESQNIVDVSDLARAVPSVEFNGPAANYNSKTSIRGLSTESYSRTAEQAVSFVLDGVVVGKAPTTTLFDINRVEVLRGPQGTLFGKNASAGVISVTTNAPDPEKFAIAGRADLGNEYDYRILQAAVNIPLGDTLAIRLNGGQNYQKGLYYNNVRDEDSLQQAEGGRIRLLWQPTDTFRLNLIGDYEQQYVTEQIFIIFNRYKDPDTGEDLELPNCGGAFATPDNRISCNGDPTQADRYAFGYSAQIDWDIGDFTLTSISAYRRYYEDQQADIDGLSGSYFRNGNIYDNRVLTQELRLASPNDEVFQYTVGLFYFDTKIPNVLDQVIGTDGILSIPQSVLGLALCTEFGICLNELVALRNPNTYTADITSKAVFGEFSWRFADAWRLLTGARYTMDDVSMVTSSLGTVFIRPPGADEPIFETPTFVLSPPLLGRETQNNLSWKLGLQYEFVDDMMAYATVSDGYKGPQIIFVPPKNLPSFDNGAIRQPHPAFIYTVDPEYPRAYELGLKSTWFDGLIAANLALFHTRVEGYQSSQFNDNGEFVPINISEVITQGMELDVFGMVAPGVVVNFGAIYNEATYPDGYLWPCTQVGRGCNGVGGNNFQDIGGEQLAVAPKWKINFAPAFDFGLPFGLRGFASADVVYRSSMRYMPNFDTRTEVGPRTLIGGRIGIRDSEKRWEMSIFGRNLTNERNPSFLLAPYLVDELTSPGIDTAGHVLSTESFRLLGLSAAVRF